MHDIKFNFILIKFSKLIYFDHTSLGGGEETNLKLLVDISLQIN